MSSWQKCYKYSLKTPKTLIFIGVALIYLYIYVDNIEVLDAACFYNVYFKVSLD